jgi:hypothetical protein
VFEKIAHGISEVFSDVMPHTFCVGCFLQGLVEGAVLAIATVAIIAALPEALAIAATVGLAVYGVYGLAQLAKSWSGMSDGAKSKALGNITGSLAGGFAGAKMVGPVEAPPGVQLLETPEGDVIPVVAATEEAATGGAGSTSAIEGGPEGLAYRTDLPDHLAGPDGFKAGILHGTHNLDNALAALDSKNAQYSLKPTSTNGISELSYKYYDAGKGTYVSGAKTVYDPKVYSDEAMLTMAQDAGRQGFEQYLKDPAPRYDVSQNGLNFRVNINFDANTGAPYVGNVHPIE